MDIVTLFLLPEGGREGEDRAITFCYYTVDALPPPPPPLIFKVSSLLALVFHSINEYSRKVPLLQARARCIFIGMLLPFSMLKTCNT